jgi:hypothetical protein
VHIAKRRVRLGRRFAAIPGTRGTAGLPGGSSRPRGAGVRGRGSARRRSYRRNRVRAPSRIGVRGARDGPGPPASRCLACVIVPEVSVERARALARATARGDGQRRSARDRRA